MHIPLDLVRRAISELGDVHPFFGITYLVCKHRKLPVGRSIKFPINKSETDFLNLHYKPDVRSSYYFQPLRTSNPSNRWLSPKYASSGSQSTRTRGQLAAAFIHKIGSDAWGWDRHYVRILREKLDRDKTDRIPAFWLAVWLFRDKVWPVSTNATGIIRQFFDEFGITESEKRELFRTTVPDLPETLLVDEQYSDDKLLRYIEPAPDAKPEEGGTLKYLGLRGLGPTHRLEFNPGERLSVITGDNGLGKTFLLECAWWSLTGQWAERQAYPRIDAAKSEPAITFRIAGQKGFEQDKTIQFDWNEQLWPAPKGRPTIPGLILYARVDGSFAIWDPIRHGRIGVGGARDAALVFSRSEVIDGLPGRIEGLLRDWVKWQHSPDQSVFEMFKAVLRRLSPPDMNPLVPDAPVRLPNDAREIPTLRHVYDVVPFINESAGVRRIVTFAYLLVWAWNEHKIGAGLAKRPPQKRMVILIDEIEAHLHPKWQRVVLPAILDVANILGRELEAQIIVATHSPLILASLEQDFSESQDKLLHLQLAPDNSVAFSEVAFVRHGRIDAWLTSELFELRQPTSQQAENALEHAKRVLAQDKPDKDEIREVSRQLSGTLPPEDAFWPRWLYFAQQKGVKL